MTKTRAMTVVLGLIGALLGAGLGSAAGHAGTGPTESPRAALVRAVAEPPSPTGSRAVVAGATCSDDGFCLTVGNGWTAAGAATPIARHLVDGKWVDDRLPALADGTTTYRLWSASCATASFCMVAGSTGSGNHDYGWASGRLVVLVRTDNTWRPMTLPTSVGRIYGDPRIDCSAPDFCLAVNISHDTEAWLWDGDTWSRWRPTVDGWESPWTVSNMACSDAEHCVAIASNKRHGQRERRTLIYDDTGWTVSTASPPEANADTGYGLACAETICVASSSVQSNHDFTDGEPYLWTGEDWTTIALPTEASAGGAHCDSESCTVLSQHGRRVFLSWFSREKRWNQELDLRLPAQSVVVGHACAATVCVVLDLRGAPRYTEYADGSAATLIADGTAVTKPWKLPGSRWSSSVEAIDCPTARYCLAAGYWGADSTPYLAEWSGKGWTQLRIPVTLDPIRPPIVAVSCTAPKQCAVSVQPAERRDRKGTVLFQRGDRWRITHPVGGKHMTFEGIECTSRSWCVLTGQSHVQAEGWPAIVQRWDGRRWTKMSLTHVPRSSRLRSVACSSDTHCTAVGEAVQGNLDHPIAADLIGGSWHVTKISKTYGQFDEVSCLSADHCIALRVGGGYRFPEAFGGVYEKRPGAGWMKVLGNAGRSQALSCVQGDQCTVASRNGIWSWNGKRWSKVASVPSTTRWMSAISCPSARVCHLAGAVKGSEVEQHLLLRR